MQQYYNKISEQKRIAFVDNLTDEQALEISENYPFAVCFANADIDPENGKFPVIWLNGQRYGFSSINQNTTKINDVNLSLYIDENGILGLTAENNDFNITPNTSQTITESYLDVKAIIPNHDYSKLTWTLDNLDTNGKTFKFNNSNENTISEVQSVRVIPNNTSKPEANKGSINLVINNGTQSTINGKITLESTFTQDESINENTYSADLKATYESLTPKQIRITYKNSTQGLTVGNWSWNIPTLPEGITYEINNIDKKSTITFTNNTTSDYTINGGIIKVSNTNANPNEISVNEFTIPGKLINSIDISWNGADLGTINGIELGTINTTNDLLNAIKVLAQAINTTPEPIENQNPTYTAPYAKSGLIYDGTDKQLINAGTVSEGGTMKYSLDNLTWAESIPTGRNAGSYRVYWKIDASTGYNNVGSTSINVNIAKANITTVNPPEAITGLTYTGSGQVLITAGSASTGGTMYYKVNTGSFTSEVNNIKGTNAGSYTITYYAKGNNNYNDSQQSTITVSIAKINSTLDISNPVSTIIADGDNTTITITSNVIGKLTLTTASGTGWQATSNSTSTANTEHIITVENLTSTTTSGSIESGGIIATFTPTDTTNYNTLTNQNVLRQAITLSAAAPQPTYYWYVGKDENLLGKNGTSYNLDLSVLPTVNSIDNIYSNSQSVGDIENNIYVVCPTEWVGQFKLTDLDNNEIPQSDKTSQIISGVTGYSILRGNGKIMDSIIKVVRN